MLAGAAISGSQARRDCLAASRAVARHLARARSPRSPCHRVMERSADHGKHGVDADLGHQLDRELAPVALRQRLRDDQPRLRRRDRPRHPDLDR